MSYRQDPRQSWESTQVRVSQGKARREHYNSSRTDRSAGNSTGRFAGSDGMTQRMVTPVQQPQQQEPRRVSDAFSASSIVASGLAAVVSFLLSSRIGLTGSLIGVGVAAAASAAVNQLFKGVLSSTSDKIRAGVDDAAEGMRDDAQSQQASLTSFHAHEPGTSTTETEADVAVTGTRIAPEQLRKKAERQANAGGRKAIIITIICAVVAVLVYAGIVTLATSGQGIGPTPGRTTSEVATSSSSETSVVQKPQTTNTDESDSSSSEATNGKSDSKDTSATTNAKTDTNTKDQTTGTTTNSKTTTDSENGQSSKNSTTPTTNTDNSKDSSKTDSDATTTNETPSKTTQQTTTNAQ